MSSTFEPEVRCDSRTWFGLSRQVTNTSDSQCDNSPTIDTSNTSRHSSASNRSDSHSPNSRFMKVDFSDEKITIVPQDLSILNANRQEVNCKVNINTVKDHMKFTSSTLHSVTNILKNNESYDDIGDKHSCSDKKFSRTPSPNLKESEFSPEKTLSDLQATILNTSINLINAENPRSLSPSSYSMKAANIEDDAIEQVSQFSRIDGSHEGGRVSPGNSILLSPGDTSHVPDQTLSMTSPTRRRARLAFSIDRIMEPSPKKSKALQVIYQK